MAYDYKPLFANIVAAAASEGSFNERMRSLIDYCEQQLPHEQWGQLRLINYEGDRPYLGQWLSNALAEADPNASFKGFWFGLNNPVVNGQTTADIYVCGSTKYEDGSIDWAAEASFFPASGYLNSRVLSAIYVLAYGAKPHLRSSRDRRLGNDAEYPLALAYGVMVARTALEATSLGGPFSQARGAAAGFDSGDYLRIGTFHHGRFHPKIDSE